MMTGGQLHEDSEYLSAYAEIPAHSVLDAVRFMLNVAYECNKSPRPPPLPIDICNRHDTVEKMGMTQSRKLV